MGSLDNAKSALGQALSLKGANGHTARAEPYFNAAERWLEKAIAEEPMNPQVHFTYARLLEARQQYDEAGARYRHALSFDPTNGTIQAAYEAMQIKRERDELAKRLGAVEAEASPTPPALEPIVEEEEFMAEIASQVEEAPLVEEGPVGIEEPYRDAPGLAPTVGAVEAEAPPTPSALGPIVEEEEFMAEIVPQVEEAPLIEEGPVGIEEPYRDAPGFDSTVGAVEAEASPTPPVLEPVVEEEERVAEIAPGMEEAPPIGEGPVGIEKPYREVDGYWALGIYKVEERDLIGGEEAFLQALNIEPCHAGALEKYSSLLLDQERYLEALTYLTSLAKVAPSAVDTCLAGRPIDTSASLLALRGSLRARQGDREAAEPLLRKALELEPKRVEWIVDYAKLLDELNRRTEAIEWLRGALIQELGHVALHREYARLMAEQGQYDEVERHLKRALALDPDDPETLALRDELQADLEVYKAACRRMALARIRAKEGLSDVAEALFKEALQIDDDHLPTLKVYAMFLEQQKRFSDAGRMWTMVAVKAPEEAEAILQKILKIRGGSGETLNSLARICIQLGRIDEAVEYLRRSLNIAPDSPETLRLLADVLEEQDRHRDAETLLGNNLVAVKANFTLSLQYARLLAARGNYDQAGEFYQRALELAPDNPVVRASWEEVAERIERSCQASKEMAWGWMKAQAGNYAEAEKCYQQALSIDPEHVDTLCRYAQLLEADGRPMEASSYLIQLARFDPEAAEEHYRSIAGKLDQVRKAELAWALAQEMIKIDPAKAESLFLDAKGEMPPGEEGSAVRIHTEPEAAASEPTSPEDDKGLAKSL